MTYFAGDLKADSRADFMAWKKSTGNWSISSNGGSRTSNLEQSFGVNAGFAAVFDVDASGGAGLGRAGRVQNARLISRARRASASFMAAVLPERSAGVSGGEIGTVVRNEWGVPKCPATGWSFQVHSRTSDLDSSGSKRETRISSTDW